MVSKEMGLKNYLIAGGSGTGKTTVAEELQRRGYHVLHGDRELCYRGDPRTGIPVEEPLHKSDRDKALWESVHHVWDVEKVKSLMADHSNSISFFCGGSMNFPAFVDLFDLVFVLEVSDLDTLFQRIDARVALDPTDWGAKPEEKEIVARLHATKEGVPPADFIINAAAPLERVVNEILTKVQRA